MDRKQEKQTFRGLGWIENENFHASEPSDEQNRPPFFAEMSVGSRKIAIFYRKSEKTGFPHPGENQKSAKTAFPHPGESQKQPKTTFPHPGENQNRPKTAFPHPGENQKSLKTAFPHPGESKKTAKTAFPHPGEKQKSAKTAFPPRGKSKITQRRVPQNEDPDFAPPGWLYIFLKTNSLKINNRAL